MEEIPGIEKKSERNRSVRRLFERAANANDVNALREMIMSHGMPPQTQEDEEARARDGKCTLRGRAWCVLLGVDVRNADAVLRRAYAFNLSKGRCRKADIYGSISRDVGRTFATASSFRRRVEPRDLEKVLVATVNSSNSLRYIQGMSPWCGMFLYEMPHHLAFECLRRFAGHLCPAYIRRGNPGAHRGVELLEQCMAALTPEVLSVFRKTTGIEKPLVLFAFSPMLSFSSSIPPLNELRQLWDVMLSYGLHLNVIFVLAYIVLRTDELIEAQSLEHVQRIFDPRRPKALHARSVVHIAMKLVPRIGDALYAKLESHCRDASVS